MNSLYFFRSKVVPVFTVSSVSGMNLPLLNRFFNVLPPKKNPREQEKLMQNPPEFQVSQFFFDSFLNCGLKDILQYKGLWIRYNIKVYL